MLGLIVVACFGLMVAAGSNQHDGAPTQQTLLAPTCAANWRSCTSDEEVANNWYGWSGLRHECERAASAQAKYGEPKWPSYAFGHYRHPTDGTSFVGEGKAILVEPDAQFQNMFGAMVHVRLWCFYDLANGRVSDVSFSDRDIDENIAKLQQEQARKDQARAAPRAECHPTADIICERWSTPAPKTGH